VQTNDARQPEDTPAGLARAAITALGTPMGAAALAAADELIGAGPLAAGSALRARGFDAALASAALTQATLRRSAVAKLGPDAQRMFFTRPGLEQATRGIVSTRRASRLAAACRDAAPGRRPTLVDLGCGIGADAIAFALAGFQVLAVELDPATAAVARANALALDLADRIEVREGDATAVALDGVDAVFCDPARRTTGGRRVFDPSRYSPSWDFVTALPQRVPRTVLKLAPGIDHALLPAGCEAEWVSVNGDVVEAACWCGPLAEVRHRATVLRSAPGGSLSGSLSGSPGRSPGREPTAHCLTGQGTALGDVAAVRRYLYDPDGAVVRAHLVAEFADTVGGSLADQTIAYVYADTPTPTPFGRCYEVIEQLPIGLKRLRAALRARGVGTLTIIKRGSALDVEQLRRDLRLAGDETAVLALTRVAGVPTALLCRPVEVRRP
jgi:SAM-dependent methyltransferase